MPQPISTQAAYQSWIAWYHTRPSAPADADGPRFRQLLSAADGDLYFVKGLDDASPQVRELSKRALMRSLTLYSYTELMKRLSSLDAEVRQQAQQILAALAILQTGDPGIAVAQAENVCRSPTGYDSNGWRPVEPSQLGLSFHWGVPFGGLMRVALANPPLDEQKRAEWLELYLYPDVFELMSLVTPNLEPPSLFGGSRFDDIRHRRRLLAQATAPRIEQKISAQAAKIARPNCSIFSLG